MKDQYAVFQTICAVLLLSAILVHPSVTNAESYCPAGYYGEHCDITIGTGTCGEEADGWFHNRILMYFPYSAPVELLQENGFPVTEFSTEYFDCEDLIINFEFLYAKAATAEWVPTGVGQPLADRRGPISCVWVLTGGDRGTRTTHVQCVVRVDSRVVSLRIRHQLQLRVVGTDEIIYGYIIGLGPESLGTLHKQSFDPNDFTKRPLELPLFSR